MAVWIQIIGKRKKESRKSEREFLSNILRNLKLDLSFLGEIYNQDIWKLNDNQNIEYFEYKLGQEEILDSIRLTFSNEEFLDLSGPFEFFSKYYEFIGQKNEESTRKWREIFKEIAKVCGITDLYYFSEDFFPLEFIYDGEAKVNDLFDLLIEKNRVENLDELNCYNYFVEYCVQNPSANSRLA